MTNFQSEERGVSVTNSDLEILGAPIRLRLPRWRWVCDREKEKEIEIENECDKDNKKDFESASNL